ncbi:MAG TPA: transposase [Burkholderiales bacterium]|nr:transposase [Burkholderiales bacterium]
MIPDVSLHVVQRGHDRNDCFFEQADYLAYLDDLERFAARFGCSVHAYCLMTNHVHLLLTPHTPDACAQVMKNVGQRHVQRINTRRQRTGTLWEGRFYSCPVASERYALACYRYIELNPVEATMVEHPRQYRWSSYHLNAQGADGGFIHPHPAYAALSPDSPGRGQAYVALFNTPLDQTVIDDIRKATRSGYVVGSPRQPRGRRKSRAGK